MKQVYVAALAAVFGLGSMGSVALHAATHPSASNSGIFSGSALPASADQDDNNQGDHGDRGRGHGRGHRKSRASNCNQGYQQYGQQYGQQPGQQYGRENDPDDNNNTNNGRYNCGTYGNGQYGNGQYGNGTVSGLIVGVNGNRITLQQGYSNRLTIDDQPALDRQQTGRVYVGRSITASGYYQNGLFYATSIR